MNCLPFESVEREVVVKVEASTDPSLGCLPDQRSTEELVQFGVIDINKSKGPTSHMVSEYVQKILNIKKCGHGGSLDPAVTGVLPVALGRATRIVQFLLKAGKEYVCILHLHDDVPEDKVRNAVNKFVGRITQLPPVKSAVKRSLRQRHVYYVNILEIDGRDILLRVGCEAGTYIRKLCHDIGKALNVGAHMAELVRTKAGPFSEKDWITLQDLDDAYHFWKDEGNDRFLRYCIRPVEFAVRHLPKVWVHDSAVNTLANGANLNLPGIVKLHDPIKPAQNVAVMTLKGELVAVGKAEMSSKEMIKEEKGLAVRTEKVFMLPGVYKLS